MVMPSTIAVLTSGGLDSVILIDYLSRKGVRPYALTIQPIYIRSGHHWETAELFWLKRFLKVIRNHRSSFTPNRSAGLNLRYKPYETVSHVKPLVVLDLTTQDLYQNHWSLTGKKVPGAKSHDRNVYLPGKNLLLISKAAVFCALHKIPNLALGPLQSNPFPDAQPEFFKAMEKALEKGLGFSIKIHVPFLKRSKTQVMSLGRDLPLHLTFSCLSPKKMVHCGRCNKCAERKKAFRLARMVDRTRYAR